MTPDGSAPWLRSRPAVDLAVAALPLISDETASKVIVELAMTIADLREESAAIRAALSAALAALHNEHAAARRRIEDQRERERREWRPGHLTTHGKART